MPGLITHYSFARDIALSKDNSSYLEAYFLGAQGPDPFMYYAQLKKRPNKLEVRDYGGYIHHHDPSKLYAKMFEYAYSSPWKNLLFAYLEGVMTHYSLDRFCHPYIFYKTGFSKDKSKAKYYFASHVKFESYLDVIIARKKKILSYKFNRYEEVKEEELRIISKMWFDATKEVYGFDYIKEDSFYLSAIDHYKTLNFLNRVTWFKKALIRIVMGKGSLARSFVYPRRFNKIEKDLDYLNEKKEIWLDPYDGRERNESFLELEEKARDYYFELEKLINKSRGGIYIEDELRNLMDNLDHDGKPIGTEFSHFKQIWPSFPNLP